MCGFSATIEEIKSKEFGSSSFQADSFRSFGVVATCGGKTCCVFSVFRFKVERQCSREVKNHMRFERLKNRKSLGLEKKGSGDMFFSSSFVGQNHLMLQESKSEGER